MWPFDDCVEWSIMARNLAATGHDQLQIYRALALEVLPFNNAVIVRARARGNALVQLQDQTGIDVWPSTINIPYPQPPSVMPPQNYDLFATVKVELEIDGVPDWRTLTVPVQNGSPGVLARAIIELAVAAFAARYNTTYISWHTTFWR